MGSLAAGDEGLMEEEIVVQRIIPMTCEQRIATINADLPKGCFYMERDMTLEEALKLYPVAPATSLGE